MAKVHDNPYKLDDPFFIINYNNKPKYTKPPFKLLCCLPIVNRTLFHKKNTYIHCNDTSSHKNTSLSWIKLYRIVLHKRRDFPLNYDYTCSFKNCYRKGILGAHIRSSSSFEKTSNWYVVPACHFCNNQRGKAAQLKSGTLLIKISKKNFMSKRKFITVNKSNKKDVIKNIKIKHID